MRREVLTIAGSSGQLEARLELPESADDPRVFGVACHPHSLKGGTMDVVDGKGQTKKKMVWESGKAYWLEVDPPGEQHADLNRGAAPIEVMVVEMVK